VRLLIYARVERIIDPLLLKEQAGFRHGRSTVDQVTLLTQDIEDNFLAKKKAGALFVDLTTEQPTTLHGIANSSASYGDCYLTGTWPA